MNPNDAAGGSSPTFYRPRQDRFVAGVCDGIAEYLGWDPKLVRLVAAGLLVIAGPLGIVAYLLFWIFLPVRPR